MKNSPTKSFVMLLLFIVLLIYTAIILTKAVNLRESIYVAPSRIKLAPRKAEAQQDDFNKQTWQKYTNAKYSLSFSYPGLWQPKVYALDKDYDVIELVNAASPYSMKIYVSAKDYFAMSGLPTKKTTVGGKPALNVKDMLVGVKNGSRYYTFDLGSGSAKLVPVFKDILASVSFK